MLQKEDPTGEGHIRMTGGVPKYIEAKAGYWDGAYQYLDENENFVTSIRGYKVDIHCIDIQEYALDLADNDEDQKWEDVESNFKFELDGYADEFQRNERIRSYLETARAAWEEMRGIKKTSYDRSFKEMLENAKKGWSWFQNKLVDTEGGTHHYYTWKIFDENGKSLGGSNVHMTESIKQSGEWIRTDNNVLPGYYQWILKDLENIKPKIQTKEKPKKKMIDKIISLIKK